MKKWISQCDNHMRDNTPKALCAVWVQYAECSGHFQYTSQSENKKLIWSVWIFKNIFDFVFVSLLTEIKMHLFLYAHSFQIMTFVTSGTQKCSWYYLFLYRSIYAASLLPLSRYQLQELFRYQNRLGIILVNMCSHGYIT